MHYLQSPFWLIVVLCSWRPPLPPPTVVIYGCYKCIWLVVMSTCGHGRPRQLLVAMISCVSFPMECCTLGKICTPCATPTKKTTKPTVISTQTPWPLNSLPLVPPPPPHIKRQLVTSNFTCKQRSMIYFRLLLLLLHCCVTRRPRRITQHTHNNQRLLWSGT